MLLGVLLVHDPTRHVPIALALGAAITQMEYELAWMLPVSGEAVTRYSLW